jgi:hypothetical protein
VSQRPVFKAFRPSRQRQGGIFAVALAVAALGAAGALLLARHDEPEVSALPAASDPGPVHVHGLGRNPADGALFIATHTGTWRLARDSATPERVGSSRQDTMGFTVAGANRFLGSGHPDIHEARAKGLPSRLGLIESTDAGRSWTPISLLGRADFHVLRAVGKQLYGVDSGTGALFVSSDLGQSWTRRELPAPIVDLTPHPRRPSVVLASTERGLEWSGDAGRSWTRLGDGVGLLAWPKPDRLYLVSQGGQVFESPDGGTRWRQRGTLPDQPSVLLADGGRRLYAALEDGTIRQSLDRGASWAVRARP